MIRQGPTPSSRRPPTGGGRLPVRARAEPHALRRPGRAVRSQCAPAVSNCGNRPSLIGVGVAPTATGAKTTLLYLLSRVLCSFFQHPPLLQGDRFSTCNAAGARIILRTHWHCATASPRRLPSRRWRGGGINQPTRQKGRNRILLSLCPADMRNNSTLRGAPVNPSQCDVRLTSEHDSRNTLNRTGARSTGRTATTPMTRGAQPQELAARQRIQY